MKIKQYLIPGVILLVVLGTLFLISIRNNQRAMLEFFEEEARSFLSLMAQSQENSIFVEGELEGVIVENLMNIVSYLNEIDYDQNNLDKVRYNFDINSVVVYDLKNKKVIIRSGDPYEIDYKNIHSSEKFRYYYFSVLNEKYIRFIYKTLNKCYQFELSAGVIKQFSQEYGISKILNQLKENPLVQYLVLQDLKGIIFATTNVAALSRIESDTVLLKALNNQEEVTRITTFGGKNVLEVARPFIVNDEVVGMFRVGMNLDNYYRHLRNTNVQLAMVFVVLFTAGICIFAVFLKYQNFMVREQFFARILGAVDEGILVVDNRGRIIGVNRMFSKITEMPENTIFNRKYGELFMDDPFSIDSVRRTASAIENEKEIFQKRIQYATYPMVDSKGMLMGTISVLHDVTLLRKYEKEQKERERLSFLGNLVANFAHEIKNPLNSLAIAAQRLQREFPVVSDEHTKLISVMLTQIDSLTHTVNDFLSLIRPQVKETQEFDLSRLIREIGTLIKEQAAQHQIAYVEQIPDNIVMVGDPEEIKRALLNLLLNAIESLVSANITNPEIEVSLMKDSDRVVIMVKDNGPGISESAQKRIFEPYYTTKKGGTGLGLYITHRIIQEHNGLIKVQSDICKGTTFTVVLPCQ